MRVLTRPPTRLSTERYSVHGAGLATDVDEDPIEIVSPLVQASKEDSQSQVVFDASSSEETWFNATTVITFMLCVGLAHFTLIVGGLMGSRGAAKWEAIEEWVRGVVRTE